MSVLMVVVIEKDGEKVCETRLCVLTLKSVHYFRGRCISSPLPLPYLSNTFPPLHSLSPKRTKRQRQRHEQKDAKHPPVVRDHVLKKMLFPGSLALALGGGRLETWLRHRLRRG